MKKTITAILCCLSFTVFGRKVATSSVPAPVRGSFGQSFRNAANVKWELEHGDYEASFMQQGLKMSVLYDAAGKLKETEQEMPIAKLPKQAMAYVQEHYPGAKIKDAAMLTMPDGRINYEAAIKGQDVIFDDKGGFLKAQKD